MKNFTTLYWILFSIFTFSSSVLANQVTQISELEGTKMRSVTLRLKQNGKPTIFKGCLRSFDDSAGRWVFNFGKSDKDLILKAGESRYQGPFLIQFPKVSKKSGNQFVSAEVGETCEISKVPPMDPPMDPQANPSDSSP